MRTNGRSFNQLRYLLIIMLMTSGAILLHTTITAQGNDDNNPSIEIANGSGVAGYEIGIFGNSFGTNQQPGSVTILGAEASIVEWSDQFIRAVVPAVPDGSDPAGLVVTTKGGNQATTNFTAYTIDPAWLTTPPTHFTNVSHGKAVTVQGVDDNYRTCSDEVSGAAKDVTEFLLNYHCRYGTGARFFADASTGAEAIVTIDFGSPLREGPYLFQWFSRADWSHLSPGDCLGPSHPYSYAIESSADGGASWTELAAIEANGRGNRSHFLTMPADQQHVRLRVTDSISDCYDGTSGKEFELNYVHLYAADVDGGLVGNALTIYGDSLTNGAFSSQFGPSGVGALATETFPNDLPFTPIGLVGRKATDLAVDNPDDRNQLAPIYSDDAVTSSARYFGLALGTNDMGVSSVDDPAFSDPNSLFNQFDEALETEGILWLIERGHAPIIARLPDTTENGFGFFEAKKKLLGDIDRLAATYRLIPGPDLYTSFRLNIERQDASWFSDDGTHHNIEGHQRIVQLWAQALRQAQTQPVPLAVTTSGQSGVAASSTLLFAVLFVASGLSLCGLSLWMRLSNQ